MCTFWLLYFSSMAVSRGPVPGAERKVLVLQQAGVRTLSQSSPRICTELHHGEGVNEHHGNSEDLLRASCARPVPWGWKKTPPHVAKHSRTWLCCLWLTLQGAHEVHTAVSVPAEHIRCLCTTSATLCFLPLLLRSKVEGTQGPERGYMGTVKGRRWWFSTTETEKTECRCSLGE